MVDPGSDLSVQHLLFDRYATDLEAVAAAGTGLFRKMRLLHGDLGLEQQARSAADDYRRALIGQRFAERGLALVQVVRVDHPHPRDADGLDQLFEIDSPPGLA